MAVQARRRALTDGDALRMDRAKVAVLKQVDCKILSGLQAQQGRTMAACSQAQALTA
jgi:hypothetical protein